MSELDMTLTRTALGGVSDTGAAGLILSEAPLRGMVTLRADLSDDAVVKAIKDAVGTDIPTVRRATDTALWMSPDELMLFMPYGEAGDVVDKLTATLSNVHHLAVDVSDARTIIRLEGDASREVLAKGAPVDLSRSAFGVGDLRRTRISQVAAAFWQTAEGPDVFEMMCFCSYAPYLWEWLVESSREGSMPGVL